MIPEELTQGQFDTVYNVLSLCLAAQLFGAIFLFSAQGRVLPRYRQALLISGTVCGIAAYHYFRIFESFKAAFTTEAVGGKGMYTQAAGHSFNEGYRYVDWLLTVPLLLIELVLVMRLSQQETMSKSVKLGLAAALMIILGYPGEIADDNMTRAIWGTLSTIPFLYIVWELFRGLGDSIERQPESVRGLIKQARLLTFASWGFYPIVYMIPYTNMGGGVTETYVQVGYTIADIIAKAGVGVLVYLIAIRKSRAEYGEMETKAA